MKNKLTDLNNYLFEQIEKLNDDDLTDEELDKQIKKAEAIQNISETIIKNSELTMKVAFKAAEYGVVNIEQFKHFLAEDKNNVKKIEDKNGKI